MIRGGITDRRVKRTGTCSVRQEAPCCRGRGLRWISALLVLVAMPGPLRAAQDDVASLAWEHQFGSGGAGVPLPAEYPDPGASPLSLTNVIAVVFPPDTHDILFVGEYEQGRPGLLSPESLSDALVVAYRAMSAGTWPAVSIDYTKSHEQCLYYRSELIKQGYGPEKLQKIDCKQADDVLKTWSRKQCRHYKYELIKQGYGSEKLQDTACIKDGDDLNVRYEGGIEATELGHVAFEADRIMKGLSLGKDNEQPKLTAMSNVKGYKNRLQLRQEYGEITSAGQADSEETHRFWITPLNGSVERSDDGRTMYIETELGVEVRQQVATEGGMQDAAQAARESAKAFAAHMTAHYGEFGEEYPVFAQLQEFAKMTYGAQTLLAQRVQGNRYTPSDTIVDYDWLRSGYQVQPVTTKPTTRAAMVRSERHFIDARNYITPTITGGVVLKPTISPNTTGRPSQRANRLQRAVLSAYGRNPVQPGIIRSGGKSYNVVVVRLGREERLESWQTDLSRGLITVSRDYGNRTADVPSVLGDWRLRVPEIAEIGADIQYENEGMAPAHVRIRDRDGRTVKLDQFASLTWPGNKPVRGYLSRDGSKSLYFGSQVWIYVDGEIRFRSINNGPYKPVFGKHDYMVEFSSDGKHAVQRVESSEGIVHYRYKRDRLVAIEDNHGGRVRLKYSPRGMLARIEYGDGELRGYRYDGAGRLAAVIGGHGHGIEYEHDAAGGELRGMRARVEASSSPIKSAPGFRIENPPGTAEQQAAKKDLKERGIDVVSVEYDPVDDSMIRISDSLISIDDFHRIRASVSDEGGTSGKRAVERLLRRLTLSGQRHLTTGPADLRNDMAEILRHSQNIRSVATASDIVRANRLFGDRSENQVSTRAKVYFKDSPAFDRQTAGKLDDYAANSAGTGNVVIVAGHNDTGFEKYLSGLAESGVFDGKLALLFSCGSRNTPGLVETLFTHGARNVVYFKAPIRTGDIAPAIDYIQRGLSDGGTLQEVIDDLKHAKEVEDKLKDLSIQMEIQVGSFWPAMREIGGNKMYPFAGIVREWA